MNRRTLVLGLGLVSQGFLGCSGVEDAGGAPAVSLADVEQELAPGAHGPEVEAVHDHLAHYGFFPSAALEERYPDFAPVVADAPSDPSHFGLELEEGVRAFQSRSGLDVTGRVDRATLAAMQEHRCGNPENEHAGADHSEKYGLQSHFWTKTNVTYRLTAATADITGADQTLAIARAFNTWRNQSNFNFSSISSGTPDIEIKFFPRGSPPTGWTDFGKSTDLAYANKTRIAVNDSYNWAPGASNPHLESIVVHESGHSLGLDHSTITSLNTPVMYPNIPVNTVRSGLTQDDQLAIGVRYNGWTTFPGAMVDIASGGLTQTSTWAIGSGNTIWRYTSPPSWVQVPGNGASIAVDANGDPWVTSSNNTVWRYTALGWALQLGVLGTDIGAGHGSVAGNVWLVSTTPDPLSAGNFLLKKWNGSAWQDSDGSGVRVTVGSDGRPLVVRADGRVKRLSVFGAATGTWDDMPGCLRDIAGGPGQAVWGISCVPATGDAPVMVLNQQTGIAGSAPWVNTWHAVNGGRNATRVAVNYNSMPLVTQANGTVLYRSTR